MTPCNYCQRPMKDKQHAANPFCKHCLKERRDAAQAEHLAKHGPLICTVREGKWIRRIFADEAYKLFTEPT
jgi:hypothetical protein